MTLNRYHRLLSFPSPPLVYLSAGITSTFGKLRRAPIDRMPDIFHAGRVHVHAGRVGSVITPSLMDGRRRPRIRNTGVRLVRVRLGDKRHFLGQG